MLNRGALNVLKDNLNIYNNPIIHDAARSGNDRLISLLLDRSELVNKICSIALNTSDRMAMVSQIIFRYLPALVNHFSENYHTSDWRRGKRDYRENETALHITALCGHDLTAVALIRRGANVNIQTIGGWTPLHNASWYGKILIIRILLAHGSDIGAKYKNKWTSLHCTAYEG
jgi:ankyrin repeat protein